MKDEFTISRRRLLVSLPAFVMAPRALLQGRKPQIQARGINHVTLQVSDLKRSLDFYQGLFGMPVISPTIILPARTSSLRKPVMSASLNGSTRAPCPSP